MFCMVSHRTMLTQSMFLSDKDAALVLALTLRPPQAKPEGRAPLVGCIGCRAVSAPQHALLHQPRDLNHDLQKGHALRYGLSHGSSSYPRLTRKEHAQPTPHPSLRMVENDPAAPCL